MRKSLKLLLLASAIGMSLPYSSFKTTPIVVFASSEGIRQQLYDDNGLKEGISQKMLDQLKQEVNLSSDEAYKEQSLAEIKQVEELVYDLRFVGLGNVEYGSVVFYGDGSNRCWVNFRGNKPHASYPSNYFKLSISDSSGNSKLNLSYKGTDFISKSNTLYNLEEGDIINFYFGEPSRFQTNHNNLIKQNDQNNYKFIIRNGKLERIHEANCYFDFVNENNEAYAKCKIDFNARKIYLDLYPIKNGKQDSRIEIYDAASEAIFKYTWKKDRTEERKHFELKFTNDCLIEMMKGMKANASNDYQEAIEHFNVSEPTSFVINRSEMIKKLKLSTQEQQVYIKYWQQQMGKNTIDGFKAKDDEHAQFIDWLYQNPEVVRLYLAAGNASSTRHHSMSSYNYMEPFMIENELKALEILCQIYHQYPDSRSGIELKMAIAISKEFASGIGTWLKNETLDPIARYALYEDIYQSDGFLEDFTSFQVSDMRNIVGCQLSNEDIVYLRDWMSQNHPEMIKRGKIEYGYSLLVYRATNPDTGASIHGNKFYGDNPSVKEVLKYGGVCGTMSKFSSALCQIYGIPALPVGQPGHCAYLYMNTNYQYSIGYDVGGWTSCGNYRTSLPYLRVHLNYDHHRERFEQSEYYRYVAEISEDITDKQFYFFKAASYDTMNYQAWIGLIKSFEGNEEGVAEFKAMASAALASEPFICEAVVNK